MQLFWLEMKKIFSWKLILLVVLVNVLMFKLMVEFDLEHFPNGRPAGDLFKIEQEIIPKYGAQMDEAEFLDLKATYEKKVALAEVYLANDPQAIEVGMNTYEAFRNFDYNDQKKKEYHNQLFHYSEEDFPWELQAYEWLIDNFEHKENSLRAMIREASDGQKIRFEQLLDEEKYSVYSDTVTYNYKNYKTSLAIVIFLSIAILISPIFLRDKKANVVPLQYSAKRGRSIYRTKWLAGVVSTVFITSILLTFYMSLYSTNNTSSHFDLPLYSLGWFYHWYDITFLQYIIISTIVIFVLSILLGILTMAISTIVPNTIVLIAVQIVVMFSMIAGGAYVLVNELMNMMHAQAFIPAMIALFSIGVIVFMRFVWKREMHKDIV